MRNIIQINPIHAWLNDYSQINLNLNFNQADAFNYSRIIRNEFYGHTIRFELEDVQFDVLKQQLNEIFLKLNISNELNAKKDKILTNDFSKEITTNDFERWKQETIKLAKELRIVNFKSVKQIESVNLFIDTKFIQLASLYIQQSFDENETDYLIFKIDEYLNNQNKNETST